MIATDLSVWQTAPVRTGEKLKMLRMARGWSQHELGERADVNKETVNRIELGGGVRMSTLQKIAMALDSSVTALMDDEAEAADIDVSTYKRRDIPVIAEGEASPSGTFWDGEGKPLLFAEEWMSRPDDEKVRDPSCYAIVLRGDSMEPMLKRGMRLIVSPNIPVNDGDLAYVHLKSGERLVKAVHRNGSKNGWVLESYNRDYPPRFVSKQEVTAIHKVAYVRTIN